MIEAAKDASDEALHEVPDAEIDATEWAESGEEASTAPTATLYAATVLRIDRPHVEWLNISRGPASGRSPAAFRLTSVTFTPVMVPSWLFGIWRLMRADPSLDFAPGVRMEFLRDGRLHYHVDVGGTDQIIALVYRVEGDTLYTDNPAAPHATSVHFSHGAGDVLLLDFGEALAVFVRELQHKPDSGSR
jgi:hypothetical protein